MAASDRGVARVVYRLARAAGRDDFEAALADDGIRVPPDPGLFDLTAAVAVAARGWHAAERVRRTDLSEMAVLTSAETLARNVGDRAGSPLPEPPEVREAVRPGSSAWHTPSSAGSSTGS